MKKERREKWVTFFSPRKFLISLDLLVFVILALMGEMSLNDSRLVTVTLGDTSDEILNVVEHSADGSGGLPGAELNVSLQLSLLSFLISDEVEIQVQVVEASTSITLAFNLILTHLGCPWSQMTRWPVFMVSVCVSLSFAIWVGSFKNQLEPTYSI